MGTEVQTGLAEYRLFEAMGEKCGVLLWDPATGQAGFRFRQDWMTIDPEEASTLEAIAEDLPAKLDEMGREAFLEWIDETMSNSFRVSTPQTTLAGNFDRTLQSLFRKHVPSRGSKFETHLPLLSLQACAGKLGEDRALTEAEWIPAEVPGRKALTRDLFLVRITGRSMEPDIPDGGLCVFRQYQGGSRGGKIVLVARAGTFAPGEGAEVTVKRYESAWKDGEHGSITMHPDNPEYESWDLKRGEEWRTVGEFVCVLEDPEPRR